MTRIKRDADPESCSPARADTGDLEVIVRDYQLKYQDRAGRELRFFAVQRTVEDAVRFAALAQGPSGKRLSHQRRIPSHVLQRVWSILSSAIPDLSDSSSFDELHGRIEELIRHIPGVGELMVYDTALRIGAKLGLAPRDVYMHAGTREGARAVGVDAKRKKVSPAELPASLIVLEAREIEDVLCIYKDQLREIGAAGRAPQT